VRAPSLTFKRSACSHVHRRAVDIYDGDIEPVVYHGKTLTSRVPVRDIARAIARYAFLASPFPLILSVELHCGLPQQVLLSKILNEEFGDALVSAPVAGRPQITQLPSPDALRGRVMIKVCGVGGRQVHQLTACADQECVRR
jgi:hypothetical protein